MIIIGEKINSSISSINEAISKEDKEAIKVIARLQDKAGADYIDINAGAFVDQELNKIKWLVEAVREATSKPLAIDSPNPKAIEAALSIYDGPQPIINSISLEENRFEPVLELILKYKTKVIALCIDDSGIPDTVEDRVSIAGKLLSKLEANGVNKSDIFLDPLIKPIATGDNEGMLALQAISEFRKQFSEAHIICGLSNISYGLPARKILNRSFLIAAMVMGLDAVIADPLDNELMVLYYAANAILGQDEYCSEYISQYRENAFKPIY